MSEALEWVSRIASVAAVMVLPGLGGQWIDRRFGLGFVGPLCFAGGMALGIWYLLLITRQPPKRPQ